MAPKRGDNWSVRITRTYEELKPWIQNLSDKCEKLIVYQHDADEDVSRTHCHLMIIGYTTSDETMKMQLTKILGQRPEKTDWAWDPSVRSEDDSISYMSKKDLQPMYNKGYEDSYVVERSTKYVPKSEYVKSSGKTQYKVIAEKPEVSKKRQNDLLDEMIQKYRENYPMDEYVCKNPPFKSNEVVKIIIDTLNQHRVIFGRYKVRDYYDTIMSRLWPNLFAEKMCGMVGFVTKDFVA